MSGRGAQQRDPETKATKHGLHDRSTEGSGCPESSVGGRMCWSLWVHPGPSVCSYCSCILCVSYQSINANPANPRAQPFTAWTCVLHWVPASSADITSPSLVTNVLGLFCSSQASGVPPASQGPGQLTQGCEVYMRVVFFPLCL